MVTVKYKNAQNWEWLLLADSYFQTAFILSKYIESTGKDKLRSHLKEEFKELNNKLWTDSNPSHFMLNPMYYNLKHWIELYIKMIISFGNWGFEKEHNISTHWGTFAEIYKNKNLEASRLDNLGRYIDKLFSDEDKSNTQTRFPGNLPKWIEIRNKYTNKVENIEDDLSNILDLYVFIKEPLIWDFDSLSDTILVLWWELREISKSFLH